MSEVSFTKEASTCKFSTLTQYYSALKEGTQNAKKKILCFETIIFPLADIDHSSDLYRHAGLGCSSSDTSRPPAPSTVTTTRDAKGVWFITGSEQDRLYDVFEAMGYAVATDRLWQAETFRRSARGRLAEIFGSTQLAQDKLVRTTGYSDQELQSGFASMDAEAQEVINGYVAGFNRRIAEIRKDPSLLPFEFSAVGITSVTLEEWTYKDVLAWAVVAAEKLRSRSADAGTDR